MGDGKGLDAKNTRVGVVGWEMARGWMQRTCEVVGWEMGRDWMQRTFSDGRMGDGEGLDYKKRACGGCRMGDGRGFDAIT